jgi:hypothetical protein
MGSLEEFGGNSNTVVSMFKRCQVKFVCRNEV